MSNELVDAMVSMKEQETLNLATKMLKDGEDPLRVLELGRQALESVGKQFESGTYFLPELILAGEMLKKISQMAEPYLKQDSEQKTESLGKIVIGTVEGDVHDIGKDIVTFLLEVSGFEVYDLGVDVPAQRFVEAIKKEQPTIVGMSALLTLAFDYLKSTVEAIKEAGLREQVKIMIGGGIVDEKVRQYSGADAYGEDAVAAVTIAKKWVQNQ
jgi:5-methyltetrahydrofolate--homocysteine methyltransferase